MEICLCFVNTPSFLPVLHKQCLILTFYFSDHIFCKYKNLEGKKLSVIISWRKIHKITVRGQYCHCSYCCQKLNMAQGFMASFSRNTHTHTHFSYCWSCFPYIRVALFKFDPNSNAFLQYLMITRCTEQKICKLDLRRRPAFLCVTCSGLEITF